MASTVDPPEVRPQPGAVDAEGGFVANGLPLQDVVHDGWPTLPGSQAVNFVSVEPWEIDLRSSNNLMPSRVWGSPAWDVGRYWSEAPPQTIDQFYGDFAVEFHWNSALFQATLQTLQAGVTSIKVWKGPTARQPADLLDSAGNPIGSAVDHVLPGGGIQYFIPDGTFPYIANQRTAWNADVGQHPELAPMRIAPLPAHVLPPDMEPQTYGKLLDALGQLATLLSQIEVEAVTGNSLLGGKEGLSSRSAGLLVHSGEQLNRYLSNAATNPEAKAQAILTLQSLVATGRHVDGDLSFSGRQDAVQQAITDVVTAAYTLSGGSTRRKE